MTFAWYGHWRNFSGRTGLIAALVSWGIALFEYLLQVPANCIGYQVAPAGQLKILQEVISLSVFIPFSILILPFRTDYIWAGLCLLAAVFFMFRDKIMG
ncbi:DMT family protein [Brenneria izbisi]|uniref:DMT family protein n=1 Tax=Brenneria izbisi TaxID=2939450 RepID=A0AA42C4Q8_9GAMM|nr:DMT family protein [Brenneria izbisi]MCV9878256.1 DMT family protein [Brenneria izbisi]MCV9881679.1 DMT family protein [Brenneria izbisi]